MSASVRPVVFRRARLPVHPVAGAGSIPQVRVRPIADRAVLVGVRPVVRRRAGTSGTDIVAGDRLDPVGPVAVGVGTVVRRGAGSWPSVGVSPSLVVVRAVPRVRPWPVALTGSSGRVGFGPRVGALAVLERRAGSAPSRPGRRVLALFLTLAWSRTWTRILALSLVWGGGTIGAVGASGLTGGKLGDQSERARRRGGE